MKVMESHDAEFSPAGRTPPIPYMRNAAVTFEKSAMVVRLPDGMGTLHITGNMVEVRHRDPDRMCVEINYEPPVPSGTVDRGGYHYEVTVNGEVQPFLKGFAVRRRHYEDRRGE